MIEQQFTQIRVHRDNQLRRQNETTNAKWLFEKLNDSQAKTQRKTLINVWIWKKLSKKVFLFHLYRFFSIVENVCVSSPQQGVPISPTIYDQLFGRKVCCAAFLYLQFVFVIFWQEVSFSPTIYNQLLLWFPYSNKITNPNSKHIKATQNSFVQKSSLSNVGEIETSCTAFLYLQFLLVIFWQRENSAKAALQMLVKLTRGLKSMRDASLTSCWK